jgi:hypothetical protein
MFGPPRNHLGGKGFADEEADNGGAEAAETTVKILQSCGFRRTGNAMGQVYQCWWRICREINVSSQARISQVLRFIFICDLFNDSPS